MENIVHKFAKISFQPKEVVLTENRAASKFSWNLKPMAATAATTATATTNASDAMLDSESADTDQSDEIDSQQSRGEDNDDSDAHSSSSSSNSSYRNGRRGGVAATRRRMPARASKDNFNRVCSAIMRTEVKKKRKELQTNEQMLRSIEKIYTSKRMKKFTPANLETIFEEPSDENAADVEDDSEECAAITSQVRLVKFGARKMRRAISFNDGLNKNKNLIKKRRLKVKKTFGKRFALKKISMTEFHDRLNKSLDSAMFDGDEEPPTSGSMEFKPTVNAFMDDMQLARHTPAFE
ncbi:protein tantalus isoform X2 [Drosophila novamexicana]|uniref:protein tantalus isoform X2 n=1 Tax=Drosophila novamexicana TaxID=47314 RepID=UPI0011E5A696|nr:protein tantalus isoform X2 [Drosophila novamexicana]